jgi:hypothetical protein
MVVRPSGFWCERKETIFMGGNNRLYASTAFSTNAFGVFEEKMYFTAATLSVNYNQTQTYKSFFLSEKKTIDNNVLYIRQLAVPI